MRPGLIVFILSVMSLTFATQAFAFSVHVKSGSRGAENVVVMLEPLRKGVAPAEAPSSKRASITQEGRLFDPFVTVVQTGTTVSFPNKDPTRHHVYSFSKAKQFQLPLYLGKSKDVLFDKPGVVSMGCNIHDWMLGYVVITASPYFGISGKDGRVNFEDLPEGQYSVSYWYPGLRAKKGFVQLSDTISPALGSYDIAIPSRAVKKRPPARDDDDEKW